MPLPSDETLNEVAHMFRIIRHSDEVKIILLLESGPAPVKGFAHKHLKRLFIHDVVQHDDVSYKLTPKGQYLLKLIKALM